MKRKKKNEIRLSSQYQDILINPNNKVEKFIEKKKKFEKKTQQTITIAKKNKNKKGNRKKTQLKNLPIHTHTKKKETRSHKGDYPLFHLTAAR